jgi:hypothetical protein
MDAPDSVRRRIKVKVQKWFFLEYRGQSFKHLLDHFMDTDSALHKKALCRHWHSWRSLWGSTMQHGWSFHCANGECQFPQENMHNVIHCHLKFKVYIIQIVQAVDVDGQPHWKESSVDMLRWTSNDGKKWHKQTDQDGLSNTANCS